jgi:hypothetical protein
MSRFNDRIEQDLSHIADRATPSPNAWEAIQSRIAEHADEPEMEIIMLDENRLQKPRSQRGWVLPAAAALIVIVGGAFALTRLGDGESPLVTSTETPVTTEAPTNTDAEAAALTDAELSSEPVSVVVPGTEQWTDTGIDLSIGDKVLIEADGTVNPAAPNFPVNGPNGNLLAGLTKVERLEERNHASLIGRIGEAGAPFWVGSRHLSKANTEGRLFLGINDSLVENNAGEFTATITINPDDAASTLAVAESYIAARNAYDGAAVLALFVDDALIRDDLQRDANGTFLGIDEIDFVFNADFEGVTGVRHVDATCALGSPGSVRCTYTWENAWSRALGDDRYTDNSFVFDISEGQIESLTHTFAQGPVDGFENHISETTLLWLQTNHPDDVSTMYDSGLARSTAESLALWRSNTKLFVFFTTEVDG